MSTDYELGGHLEVASNSGDNIISLERKIVLSLSPYVGRHFPKIRTMKIDDYTDIKVRMKEYL